MIKQQQQLYQNIETDFGINKPIFLNTYKGWFDTHLAFAKDVNVVSIGRYRIDADCNGKQIQEFWFDIEWSKFDNNNKPLKLITKELVEQRFHILKQILLQLLKALQPKLADLNNVYIRTSGMGLHLFFFVAGVAKEAHMQFMQAVLEKSDLPNTKGANHLVYGIDYDSVLSLRRKIRETYSPNYEKWKVKKEVDYLNFCSCFPLVEFLKLDNYPFAGKVADVISPERYAVSQLQPIRATQATPLTKPHLPKKKAAKGTKGTDTEVFSHVKECPALMRILQEPETRVWQARHFLAKDLRYLFKMDEKQIVAFINKENKWNDYNPAITQMYVKRHFTEGRNETQVKKPIKKTTLMRYGYCLNDCKGCVYNKY